MLTTLKWLIILAISIAIGLSCRIGGADEITDLVPFVIQVESSGNPNAVSPAGAIGLMQIMPIVIQEYNNRYSRKELWYKQEELFDYGNNVKIGTWYLRKLKNHYLKIDGKDYYTIERMLASYNGGPTRMRRLLRQGKDWQDMPRESVNYVKKVLKLRQKQLD